MGKQLDDKQNTDRAAAPIEDQELDKVSGGIATSVDVVDYVSLKPDRRPKQG